MCQFCAKNGGCNEKNSRFCRHVSPLNFHICIPRPPIHLEWSPEIIHSSSLHFEFSYCHIVPFFSPICLAGSLQVFLWSSVGRHDIIVRLWLVHTSSSLGKDLISDTMQYWNGECFIWKKEKCGMQACMNLPVWGFGEKEFLCCTFWWWLNFWGSIQRGVNWAKLSWKPAIIQTLNWRLSSQTHNHEVFPCGSFIAIYLGVSTWSHENCSKMLLKCILKAEKTATDRKNCKKLQKILILLYFANKL